MEENLILAFTLTLLAGLATGVGSLLALLAKKTDKRFLSLALGFSAGVMVYVSFVEIFPKARGVLAPVKGDAVNWWVNGGFFGGVFLIALIDMLVPAFENPHEMRDLTDLEGERQGLMRMGVLSALAIGIHNFPEGLATFTAALADPEMGFSVAVAVAIHNIPEGIAVSVPLYQATGSRKKAFKWSFLSGLAEPLGALLGFLLLRPFFSDTVFGVLFALVGGIMVFISLDELLPTAQKYSEHHMAIYGVTLGMMVMALSLLLL